jgi:hypothetical protein
VFSPSHARLICSLWCLYLVSPPNFVCPQC